MWFISVKTNKKYIFLIKHFNASVVVSVSASSGAMNINSSEQMKGCPVFVVGNGGHILESGVSGLSGGEGDAV